MDNPSSMQSINLKAGLAKRAALYLGVLAFALVLLLFLGAGHASAGYVDVSGDVTATTTWESGNVYNVTGPITITDGNTLTIENNVTVNFDIGASLTVDGNLIVQGTEDLPVVFNSNGSFFWDGVTFTEGSTGDLANLNIINATIGIQMIDTNDVVTDNVIITDAATTGVMITLNEGDWEIALSDLQINNATYGIFVQTFNGSLVLNMSDVEMDIEALGLYVEVGTLNASDLRTLDLNIVDCTFNGGYVGVYASAPYYGNLVIDGSSFLGQYMVSYIVDSVEGDVNVDVTDSTFDGSSANSIVIYLEEEIESDFGDPIGQNSWDHEYTDDGFVTVDLPFTFNYDAVDYTSVDMYNDGFLYFGTDQYIYPVGSIEMYYFGGYFYDYIIADDNSSVTFQWVGAITDNSEAASCAYQVILYADGSIQFNMADMECYASNGFWGITTNSGPGYDYDMSSLYGDVAWNMDWTSWLFTPYAMSPSIAMVVLSDSGSVDITIDNTDVMNMYGGALMAYEGNGTMDLTITDSTFDKLWSYMAGASIAAYCINGSMDVTMTGNTFDYVWTTAARFMAYGINGGTYNFDVSDNVFTKTALGVTSNVEIEAYNDTADQTVSVVANFDNNTMTDSYGLYNFVHVGDMYNNMEGFDGVNWTVSVTQTFTNNTMTQERYDGGWAFDNTPSMWCMIEADMVVKNQEMDNETWLVATHDVTITGNVLEDAVGTYESVWTDSTVENARGSVTVTNDINVSDNDIVMMGGYEETVYGIDVNVDIIWDHGNALVNNDIVVDDNTIDTLYDGPGDFSSGIYMELGVGGFYYGNYARVPSNLTAVDAISVSGNVINGTFDGIYAEAEYWQYDTEGAYTVDMTMDVDDNVLTNVSDGIETYVYAEVWFGDQYWPFYDHNATGTFDFDYAVSIDNNTIVLNRGILRRHA